MRIIWLLLLLPGCASTVFEEQDFQYYGEDFRIIKWVSLSKEELQNKCYSITGSKVSFNRSILGCAEYKKDRTCTIYTQENTNHQILGHEVRHCFQGNFHK